MDRTDGAEFLPAIQALSQADKEEVSRHLQRQEQQTQINEIVHGLSATCFKKCITGKITDGSLSSGEQSCAQNCVSRWMDVQSSILKSLSGQQAAPAKSGFFG